MTSGYSATPQARKLGIKRGQRIHLDRPPLQWQLDEPPEDLTAAGPTGPADLIVSFFTTAPDLSGRLPDLAQRIYPAGSLWVAWPCRAAGHRSDLTDNIVRSHALPLGIVDVKVAAIDVDWSGQRYVWRVAARPAR